MKLFRRNNDSTDDYQTPGDTSVSYLDPYTGREVKIGNDFILTNEDMERLQQGKTLSFMGNDNCVMTLKYLPTETCTSVSSRDFETTTETTTRGVTMYD